MRADECDSGHAASRCDATEGIGGRTRRAHERKRRALAGSSRRRLLAGRWKQRLAPLEGSGALRRLWDVPQDLPQREIYRSVSVSPSEALPAATALRSARALPPG